MEITKGRKKKKKNPKPDKTIVKLHGRTFFLSRLRFCVRRDRSVAQRQTHTISIRVV
jgi:hypothetical protein